MPSIDSCMRPVSLMVGESSRYPSAASTAAIATIRIKELSERDRRHLLQHFLALDNDARLMRFGSVLPDELVTRYVQKINFSDRKSVV